MSVWCDSDIIEDGAAIFSPFQRELVNPASYDLTVGRDFKFLRFDARPFRVADILKPGWSDDDNWFKAELHDGGSIIMPPGEFLLAHTEQYFKVPDDVAIRVEGKSTLGRAGLVVHATAGWIDPGFRGHVTMELQNVSKREIIIAPGDRIGQAAIHQLTRRAEKPYRGRYQDSWGAVAGKR